MKRLWEELVRNRQIVILTFEVFWIGVFLLHAATSGAGAEVTQFVYANF